MTLFADSAEPPRSPSGTRRLITALVLVALLAAGSWWVWQARPTGGLGDAASYQLSIVAPDGTLFWNGTVDLAAGATPLSALEAASARGNFSISVQHSALGAYVRAIGSHTETATLGWTYYVDSGAGFECIHMAADQWHLTRGESVAWRWARPGGDC